MSNLAEHLFLRAAERPGGIALRFGNERYTFGELADQVRRTAGALSSIGVEEGSRVGLLMNSCPEFIIYQQAVFALGAVLAPLNVFYRRSEIAHALGSCGIEFLIAGGDLLQELPAREAAGPLQIALTPRTSDARVSGLLAGEDLLAGSQPITGIAELSEASPGMMLNTSATTGKSKGVVLTVGNIRSNYDRTPGWLGLGPGTRTLCALPLYNTFGLNQCINALMVTGGELVLMPRFDALRCMQLIEEHRCTFLPAVPTMLQKIVDHPDAEHFDLGSLSRIMTGGAPVPSALLERIRERIGEGVTVLTGYGLTEATALVTLEVVETGADGRIRRPKSIGRVLDGMELRISKADGTNAQPGEVGEICVKGPNVMAGYHGMPEHTDAALQGGWLMTGDLGHVDEQGYAYIVDRKKDLIIRGGQNVYPGEIEEVLYAVEGVSEVAVVGREDPVLGEVPVAWVATAAGHHVTAADLETACRRDLAYFKIPAAFHFLTELPKGPTGKILRRALAGR